jgi:uncharacterized membrane protein YdbT with pleckstrin-like domain
MPALDQYLAPDETVVLRTRLHPVVFGNAATFALFTVAVVVLIIARNDLAARTIGLLWLGAAGLVVVSSVPPVLRWRASAFAVTNRRVLAQVGIFSPRVIEAPLGRGGGVRIEQNMWGRLFDYATLALVGPDGAVESFPQVARAAALRDATARRTTGSSAARGKA